MLVTKEAAKRLGVTSMRVLQLISEGRLHGTKRGRDWLISEASVDAEIHRREARKKVLDEH